MSARTMGDLSRFMRSTRWEGECLLWQGAKLPKGYGRFGTCRAGKKVLHLTHRLVYTWTIGTIPEGMCVCHRCDTPSCVNPLHLFLGTYSDNMQDCSKKGRLGGHFTTERLKGKPKSPEHRAKLAENLKKARAVQQAGRIKGSM